MLRLNFALSSLAIGGLLLTGCGPDFPPGKYVASIELVDGENEVQKYPITKVQKDFSLKGGDIVTLNKDGTFNRKNGRGGYKTTDGNWFVKDGKLAIQSAGSTAQKRMSKGMQTKGPVKTFQIRKDHFYTTYIDDDTNLEVVYRKQE